MQLVFLGTAGGRTAVLNQLRATGGFILELDEQRIHVDPGPGALVRAKQFGVNLQKLTCICVSHCHPDHYTDGEVVLEAMTLGANRKRGVVIGNEHVMRGGGVYRQVFSPYHLNAVEKYYILKPDESVTIGSVEITATPTRHTEPKGIGFVFKGSKKIGYTSDTAYFEDLPRYFKGCDYLILNVLRPRGKQYFKHMNTNDAISIINECRPKKAILTHFGVFMLKAGPQNEARYIEQETGVETIAAKDGMYINEKKETKNLARFLNRL